MAVAQWHLYTALPEHFMFTEDDYAGVVDVKQRVAAGGGRAGPHPEADMAYPSRRRERAGSLAHAFYGISGRVPALLPGTVSV